MAELPMFEDSHLEAICDVLTDGESGLKHKEIERFLSDLGIEDLAPTDNKRNRLLTALSSRQKRDNNGDMIQAFIQRAMNPALHVKNFSRFESLRTDLNERLVFAGYELGEDGNLSRVTKATTIKEAEERAGRLKAELSQRKVHADVLKFCRAELLQKNYFHAVFEATKSIAEKIREKTGLSEDGYDLVDKAFGLGRTGVPVIAFNSLRTKTEMSEHTGLMNILKGVFGAFRNVTAHAPKIYWPINEADAIDLLTLASLLHRRLDSTVLTGQPTTP